MASVHRERGKPNWFCHYVDQKGIRRRKSTRTSERSDAVRICGRIQEVADKAKSGKITRDRARKVIESVVADILEASGATLERRTIAEHFNAWIKALENQVSVGTHTRYAGVVKCFLEYLGAGAMQPLASLSSEDIERYRDSLTGKVANNTVNVHLKVLRRGLEKAVQKGTFDKNPARLVENLDRSKKHRREAFKLEELRRVLARADDEWRALILTCLYTGIRLSDAANLLKGNIDLSADGGGGEISLLERKTKESHTIPIARALRAHIEPLSKGDAMSPIFPNLANRAESWLSNQFHELMALAGLAMSRKVHQRNANGPGRTGKRNLSRLSFHSLRHTATSLLKNAGVSNAIAQDLIGHESEAVSRSYTHIDAKTRRSALNKMPDITASAGGTGTR